jgi:hypothetical protein
MIHDPMDENSHSRKGKQKRDRGDEHPTPRAVGDGGADQVAQPRQLKQDHQHHDNQAGEG